MLRHPLDLNPSFHLWEVANVCGLDAKIKHLVSIGGLRWRALTKVVACVDESATDATVSAGGLR